MINDRRLLQLIDKEGKNQSEAAEALKVSRQAVSKRLQELRGRQCKAVITSKIDEAVSINSDAIQQLYEINKKTLKLLDRAEENPELSLKCIAEVRNEIRLAADIYEKMYSIQEIHNFMQTMIDVLKGVDEDAYREFKKRANEQRSLRSVLRFVG